MEKLLTISEAAGLIEGLTKHRLNVWCKEGKLRYVSAGRKRLVRKTDIYSCLENQFISS